MPSAASAAICTGVVFNVGDVRLLRYARCYRTAIIISTTRSYARNHFNNFRRRGGGQRERFRRASDVVIAIHIGKLDRIHRHHFFGAVQADAVAGDKVVDQVNRNSLTASVQPGYRAVNDFIDGFGSFGLPLR